VRTRNARLAALHSFFHYAANRDPANLATIQRVLAIPAKRHDRPVLGFLTREQVAAILAAVDLTTWSGRRDQALLTTLYNTGARVSEALDLRVGDITRGRECALRLHGKGREDRLVPLWRSTMRLLHAWIDRSDATPESPLFPNREGRRMNRSGVAHRLRLAVKSATAHCPSLGRTRVSPHTFRHTTAMHLLQAGVDLNVIAIRLGHESPTTTHRYVEADLAMKQRALEKLPDPRTRTVRSPSADRLLSFLERL
jgi:site-specific recombinase XerD